MNTPGLPPTIWTVGTTELFKTGTWRAAAPVHRRAPSPCHLACPVNGRIAEWIARAREGNWRAAWDILSDNNPFPAVAGRICHRPCESACNRASYDAPLAVCALERHIGDRALAEGWQFPEPPPAAKPRVAVVGGGPSGLSAAYQLRRRGYAVTIFEAQPHLGGLLRDGIPPYRLPRDVLDGEIQRILRLGIEVCTGRALASPNELARLRAGFHAVYLAIGARRQKRLAQLDYDGPWVMDGAAYLARSNAGQPPALGERMVVIGGGSAAMDVARSACRAGHLVSILALEREAQMPAQREEVVQAKQEGAVLFDGAMLRSLSAAAAGGLVLNCSRVDFEAGAVRGEFRVTPIAGTDFTLAADAVVPAIGQDPQLAAVQPLAADGALLRIDRFGATSLENVFAGGDVASNARFVTHAVGMGKSAAAAIDRWLRGEAAPQDEVERAVALGAINLSYHPHAARAEGKQLKVDERLEGYAEVQAGLSAEQALAEAARCFSCGNCTFCDNCLLYCPDMAVRRIAGGYAIAADYCKGCGLCVAECPTGSMAMQEDRR